VVITGGRTVRDVHEGWRRLWPTVKVFIKRDETAAPAPPQPQDETAPPPAPVEWTPEPAKYVAFKPLQEHLERKRRQAEAEAEARQAKRAKRAVTEASSSSAPRPGA
jgi:hypothetical protein